MAVEGQWQVTFNEDVSDVADLIALLGLTMDYEISITGSGRILMIDGPETIEQVAQFVAKSGIADVVGLITHTMYYYPDVDTDELDILVTLET